MDAQETALGAMQPEVPSSQSKSVPQFDLESFYAEIENLVELDRLEEAQDLLNQARLDCPNGEFPENIDELTF